MKNKCKVAKSPYRFTTFLNFRGDTVVYLHKGKNNVWLCNIDRDGYLDFSVGHLSAEESYKKINIQTQIDDYNEVVPVIEGVYLGQKKVIERINELQDMFEKVFNV